VQCCVAKLTAYISRVRVARAAGSDRRRADEYNQ